MSSFCTHQGLPHTNHDVIHHSAPTKVYHTQIMMSSFCTHRGLPHTNHDVIFLHPPRFITHKSWCHHSANSKQSQWLQYPQWGLCHFDLLPLYNFTAWTTGCLTGPFTCPWIQQPQEQSYPVIPVYVVFQRLSVLAECSTGVSGMLVFFYRCTMFYRCMWCFSICLALWNVC